MAFTLNVNGEAREVDVDPDMPLLWVLRDELNILGPKFGCGAAMCGACTVQVDGAPVRSCITPVSAIGASSVRTVEALGETEIGQRIKDAWAEEDVMQCGYCQAGQMMSAEALLSTTPEPSDSDIDAAMAGNICRCATYVRIRAAIKRAAGLPTTDTREG